MSLISYIIRIRSRLEREAGLLFPGSAIYWNRRYAVGQNSGSGSYGRLAEFKAEYLNNFVAAHGVETVIEFGCGDGHQLSLACYPNYFGVDVAKHALKICRARFHGDSSKRFGLRPPSGERFDLAISQDVIYHLVEDDVFESYMEQLFSASSRWVIIYSSDMNDEEFRSVCPGYDAPHVKHRRISEWIAAHFPKWRLIRRHRNRYPFDANDPDNTSFADFFAYGHSVHAET